MVMPAGTVLGMQAQSCFRVLRERVKTKAAEYVLDLSEKFEDSLETFT